MIKLRTIVAVAALSLPFATHAADAAKGKVISEKVCAACHGVDGSKPIAPENPILAGQYRDYIAKALLDYKTGKRANPIMKGFAEPLSKRDIDDLAAWFSTQKSALHFQR